MSSKFLNEEAIGARKDFRASASRLGWQRSSFEVSSGRAASETNELDPADTIDVVVSGATADAPTLLITVGLHGVEGLFGSAAQLAILNGLGDDLSAMDVRVVMVSALNPWGFTNGRRADSLNRDLNRNCLLPGEVHEGSPPLYRQLDPLINPSRWPTVDLFLLKALRLISQHGFTALRRTIAQGQYEYPKGLFFGGSEAAPQQSLLSEQLPGWIGNGQRVVHVDFHTGLGDWKTWKFLPDGSIAPHHQRELKNWFGADSFSASSYADGGYKTQGGLGHWCAQQTEADYLYVCAEFGTYSGLRVLKALRRENYCHHAVVSGRMKPTDRFWRSAKEEMREMFFPASKVWQTWAIDEACRIVERMAVELNTDSRAD